MSDITIIGGGIIGVCSGLALQAEGYAVTLIDRGNPQAGASFGNCALLAVGEVVPISKPGIVTKVPKWLLDPMGPLFLRPAAAISQMPWLVRFMLAGRVARVRQIAEALAPLTHRAESDYRELLSESGISEQLVQAENVLALNHRSDYENDQFTWGLRSLHGFHHTFLTAEELRQMEPALGSPITCGVLLKGWLQFADPGSMVAALLARFIRQGGTVVQGSVARIETAGRRATALHLEDGTRLDVNRVVLAAGAWSGHVARSLGLRVPIAALQGYHHQVANPGVKLNRPVLYANGGFVLTPLSTGLRIGGTIEIAGHDPEPNFARADILAEKAKAVLPGLNTEGGTQWMGPRPFMPDTLPVIGPAPHHENVTLAFGHGQVGLTLGATTGRLVADLVARRSNAIDLTPYRVNRF